jgi:hypothetical protein
MTKFIPYAPKPPQGNIRKPISKFITKYPSSLDKSFQIDSNGVPTKVPPASGGVAGSNDWCQNLIRDTETRVQDAQVSGEGLAGTRGMYSNHPAAARYLYLILYSSLDSREGWFR